MLLATPATAGTRAVAGGAAGAQQEARLWHELHQHTLPVTHLRGKESAVLKNMLDELVKIANFIQP